MWFKLTKHVLLVFMVNGQMSMAKELSSVSIVSISVGAESEDLHAVIMAGVERGSLKAHEVNALQDAWVQHKEHLLSNHQNKAEIVMGALSERINVGEKMVNEHKKVSKKMDELDQAFASLQVLSSPDGLLRSFGTYQEELLKVLDYEEHNELILMRYFFAPQEFRPVVAKLQRGRMVLR